jgi:hypothetical protein
MPKGEKRKYQFGDPSDTPFKRPKTGENAPFEVPKEKEHSTLGKSALQDAIFLLLN